VQLAHQLKAAGIASFPCAVNYNYAKQKWEKHPLTVNRESWGATAQRPLDDPAVQWADCRVLGIPIPDDVVVIDLDTYRPGCTPETADMLFGTPLPWAQALIQTTISGGSHYAFKLPDWPVRQGANIGGPGSGVDTRVAGRGFICSGEGYTAMGAFGVMRLAHPESLPILPDDCRTLLEQPATEQPQRTELPDSDDRDIDVVKQALSHIDPSERDTWRDIGFALKHHFHDDEETGFTLWDAWSSGEYGSDDTPIGYTAETQRSQWSGFRAVREGAQITAGTLFHMALRGGWVPPARFDTSMAFGEGAASVETFNALITRVMEEGADSRKTEELMAAITASGCNEVQALLLRNELKAVMRSAKILDKDLTAVIDRKLTPQTRTVASGAYSKNHTENAQLFLQANYPGDTLIRCSEIWYAFDGRCWVERDDAAILHQLTMAMSPSLPQSGAVSGTQQILASTVYRPDVKMDEDMPSVVIFQNGVLDLFTGNLMAHDKRYFTTKILPHNFDPNAQAPGWQVFLNEIFEGDQERIALLQEWLGYMLSPSYQYQKIMLLIGPRRSGKGTIGKVLEQVVGTQNYSGASLESFADDDFMDSLRGKTVAFSGDTAKNINRNKVERVIERVKKISGGDVVDFGRKYKSRMSCVLPTRIMLAANHIPRLFDDSEALSHRILVLPFEVSYADRENPYLINTLSAEIEGITLWSLQGLARLNTNQRFTLPAASGAEMEFIAEAYSPMRSFIDACCALGDEENRVSSTDLYQAYRAWALSEQEAHILSRKVFVSTFKDATRGRGCRYGTHRGGDNRFRGFRGVVVSTKGVSAPAGAFQPKVVK
jgi:P4 family phage/plasmid primase-like protien